MSFKKKSPVTKKQPLERHSENKDLSQALKDPSEKILFPDTIHSRKAVKIQGYKLY